MIEGKTKSGFAYSISDENVNNMELLDALAEAEDENPLRISKVLRLLLGDEQRKELYGHLREENGRVPVEAVMTELKEILANDGSKNF